MPDLPAAGHWQMIAPFPVVRSPVNGECLMTARCPATGQGAVLVLHHGTALRPAAITGPATALCPAIAHLAGRGTIQTPTACLRRKWNSRRLCSAGSRLTGSPGRPLAVSVTPSEVGRAAGPVPAGRPSSRFLASELVGLIESVRTRWLVALIV
jgi:hypothetical protein